MAWIQEWCNLMEQDQLGGEMTSQGGLSLATVISTTWTKVVKPSVTKKGPSQDFTHLEGRILLKYPIIWQICGICTTIS